MVNGDVTKEIVFSADVGLNALTDSMLERIISNLTKIVELSDAIASSNLLNTINKLSYYSETLDKSLDAIMGLTATLNTLNNAFTDSMLERLISNFSRLIELSDTISNSKLIDFLEKLSKNSEALDKSVDAIIGASNVLNTVNNAFSDSMLERVVSNIAELGELTDELQKAEIKHIIPLLSDLSKSGVMESLIDSAKMLVVIRNALTDSMLERVTSVIVDTIDYFASLRAQQIGTSVLSSINCAIKEYKEKENEKVSFVSILKDLKSQETLKGLAFVLNILKRMPKDLTNNTCT